MAKPSMHDSFAALTPLVSGEGGDAASAANYIKQGLPESLRALHIAYVHFARATQSDPAWVAPVDKAFDAAFEKTDADDGEETSEQADIIRFAVARDLANHLRAWRRCAEPGCRRARKCAGAPPRCFAHMPPPLKDEVAFAQVAINRARTLNDEMEGRNG
jgi:hypothetical protein